MSTSSTNGDRPVSYIHEVRVEAGPRASKNPEAVGDTIKDFLTRYSNDSKAATYKPQSVLTPSPKPSGSPWPWVGVVFAAGMAAAFLFVAVMR